MHFFKRADVLDLKLWSVTIGQRRNEKGYMVEEPMLSQNFTAFLIEDHGTQWEVKFLR